MHAHGKTSFLILFFIDAAKAKPGRGV